MDFYFPEQFFQFKFILTYKIIILKNKKLYLRGCPENIYDIPPSNLVIMIIISLAIIQV